MMALDLHIARDRRMDAACACTDARMHACMQILGPGPGQACERLPAWRVLRVAAAGAQEDHVHRLCIRGVKASVMPCHAMPRHGGHAARGTIMACLFLLLLSLDPTD